jgi:hypothetical protein
MAVVRRCSKRSAIKASDGTKLLDAQGRVRTKPCANAPIKGGTVCHAHGGQAPQIRRAAAVRAEVESWGLGDTTADPGEILLRLVTQSAMRAERYAKLLEQAYEAAERLKQVDADQPVIDAASESDEDELPERQVARKDLERVFQVGGVAALIGKTYGISTTGHIFESGEALRGLAKLEADERDRCANFAAKAIAAGLAKRQVEIAEAQAKIVVRAIEAALDIAGVSDMQRTQARKEAVRLLRVI